MDKKSLLMLALGLGIATALFASLFVLQIVGPAQPAQIPKQSQAPQSLQKFAASGYVPNAEWTFLVFDAAKERGIWARNGLDPEFVFLPAGRPLLAADLKEAVQSGVRIGINIPSEVIKARSNSVPLKIVAGYVGETATKIFVNADSPIKTARDLDGKKIGIVQAGGSQERNILYLKQKFGINAQVVSLGNITNRVVALKLGRIDAFIGAGIAELRLVDSGELRIVLRFADAFPKPHVSLILFATEDLIEQNPDLVKRFVRAWFETVKYLKDNPSYAADLYIKRTNAPKDLADKAISQIDWLPEGLNGQELVVAVRNNWQLSKDSGDIPANINVRIEDVVDVRFLP